MNRYALVVTASAGIASVALVHAAVQRVAPLPIAPEQYASSTEWPTYGHDSGGMRFSPLDQITPANVGTLTQAWVYHLKPAGFSPPAQGRGGRGGNVEGFLGSQGTPLIVDGLMYISSPYGRVVALDATTGEEVWIYQLPTGSPATRGVEYFAGDAETPPQVVVGTNDAKLFTLDARTGALNMAFGTEGFVSLDKRMTSPPIVYKHMIIVGGRVGESNGPGTPGDVHAYDIHDGQQVWTFHSIPRPGEPNYGTWMEGSEQERSGVNVWAPMTVDVERGILYMPFGAPSGDYFGGDRPGDNLYSSSVVAADANTGAYLWHFQVVHHDVFDYDVPAPPILIDVQQGNRTIPAVGIVSKAALLFLLDRVSGEPIYAVEERPVPQSDVPGEKTSPTQPFPVKPPPLARHNFTMDDIATVTPELEAACRQLIVDNNVAVNMGPFAPITYNRSRVLFPSSIGGANWGGMAFHPDLGYVFTFINQLGQLAGIRDPASGPVDLAALPGTNLPGGRTGPYTGVSPGGRFVDPEGSDMPCNEPPWGELVAVDVNTGEIAWRASIGVTDSLPPDKQHTGRSGMGGPITTAGGLVFIGATDDARFRALDARNGKELWTVKLKGGVGSVPSTYLGRDGRQYVVVTATGGAIEGPPVASDEIIAFAVR